MTQPYTPPKFKGSSFNCPLCNAYAHQRWGDAQFVSAGYSLNDTGFTISKCEHCKGYSLWRETKMVFPDSSTAPLPNKDLPDEIRRDFEEARNIINRSPRGAAALFRLCIQKLCKHLGESGKNINNDISALVKKGLNPQIQKSLDIVRVIGNDAVHPGEIDLRDDPDTAAHLAKLVNFIADAMITQAKQIDEVYESLPAKKREEIEKRDGTS